MKTGSTATAASKERSVGFGQPVSTTTRQQAQDNHDHDDHDKHGKNDDEQRGAGTAGLKSNVEAWRGGWGGRMVGGPETSAWPPASVRRLGPSFYTASRTSTKSSEAAAAGADGGAGLRGSGADGGRGSDDKRMDKRGFPTLRRLRLHLFWASTTHPLKHMRQTHGPAC